MAKILTTQEEALAAMNSGRNVYLGGRAGTGKSFVLRKFVEAADNAGKNMAVTASTGIAARNIGGQTVHSWAGIGLGPYDDEDADSFIGRMLSTQTFQSACHRISRCEILIIDEVSMLQGKLLFCLDHLLRQARMKEKEPFGGMQVILVGDFHQLAPVCRYGAKPDWAFYAESWFDLNLQNVVLEKIYRQSDEVFMTLLNEIRTGNISPNSTTILNSRVPYCLTCGDNVVRLLTHNKAVDEYNTKKLLSLPGDSTVSYMLAEGPADEIKELKAQLLCPEVLEVKPNARVMLTCNGMGYVNGDTGRVVDVRMAPNQYTGRREQAIIVELDHLVIKNGPDAGEANQLVVFRQNFTLNKNRKKEYLPDGQEVKFNPTSVVQYPLRLAWAISVHKSQGLEFDNLYTDLSKVFAPGQFYVALSRAKRLNGLYIPSVPLGRNIVDSNVLNFYKEMQEI